MILENTILPACQVRRPIFKANMSPVQISKHVMSVESAEVEAAQAPPADVLFLGFLSFKNPDGLETLPKKYVHSPDVQSGEDTLVASLGADEMRAMHLTDASRLSLAAGIWVLGSWTLSISSVLPYIIFNDEGARHREDISQIRLGVSSRCSLYEVFAVEPSHILGINDHLARMLSFP